MKRLWGISLALLLLVGVVVTVVKGQSADAGGSADPESRTVRGVIGSEKSEFFADPEVRKVLAERGFEVKTDAVGSWSMDEARLDDYDFAFPASTGPAEVLHKKAGIGGSPSRPFYSPLVVLAHRSAAEVLQSAGIVNVTHGNRGSLSMAKYLDAVDDDTTWQELSGAEKFTSLTGTLYVSSTNPLTSSSGALYLAAASYTADGGQVAQDEKAVARTSGLLRKLVQVQGTQQSSSDAPFRDFISGIGNPLVLVYESQVAAMLMREQDARDLVVLYPDTTVPSDHSVVPFSEPGRELGELLSHDAELRELAVRHGYRPQGSTKEFSRAAKRHPDYLNPELTGIRQAPAPTSAVLRAMAERARK